MSGSGAFDAASSASQRRPAESGSGGYPSPSRSGGHPAVGRFGLTSRNRTPLAVAAALLALAIGAGLARPVLAAPVRPLLTGSAGASLLGAGFLLALRKRNKLGLRKKGAYATWAGVHVVSTVAALAVLAVHVAASRGGPVPLALTACVLAIAASGVTGASLWHRRVRSPLLRKVRKHWLKVHVLLIGPLLVALGLHIFQAVYFS